jgi:hypothetical protein
MYTRRANGANLFSVEVYSFIYFLINFVFFYSVSTSVEVILVRKLHSELVEKKLKMETLKADRRLSLSELTFRKIRKKEIDERSEQRAVIMVVVNALINLFFRLPELPFVLLGSQIMFGDSLFDVVFSLTSLPYLITDLYYFMYILTFTTNFLIFYIFNMKFKQTFSKWRHVKKRQ